MEVDIGAQAQEIITRLAAIDREHPHLDRVVVEAAIREHFLALGIAPLPEQWVDDAEQGHMAAWSAAWSVARKGAEAAASEEWWAAEAALRSAKQSTTRWAAESDAWRSAGNAVELMAEYAVESGPWPETFAANEARITAMWMAQSAADSAIELAAESAAVAAALSAARPAAEAEAASARPWTPANSGAASAATLATESATTSAAEPAAKLAARAAVWSAAWSAAEAAAPSAAGARVVIDPWIAIWRPFLDASESGLWLAWFLEDRVIAVPRPSLRVVEGRLHRDDGPAVAWPNGTCFWFRYGVQVDPNT